MIQQLIAIIVVLFFLFRLFFQKKKNQVSRNEFYFWNLFWFASIFLIIFIKKIDAFVAYFGFSAEGIQILSYLGILILFYFIFRLRVKIDKIESNITKIVRNNSINNSK